MPLFQVTVTQEIFKVEQQFLKAGTGDVDQAQLGLRRGGGGAAALGNVLPSAACGLNHLITPARTCIQETLAEPVSGVVDDGGCLKTAESAVTAAGLELGHVGSP